MIPLLLFLLGGFASVRAQTEDRLCTNAPNYVYFRENQTNEFDVRVELGDPSFPYDMVQIQLKYDALVFDFVSIGYGTSQNPGGYMVLAEDAAAAQDNSEHGVLTVFLLGVHNPNHDGRLFTAKFKVEPCPAFPYETSFEFETLNCFGGYGSTEVAFVNACDPPITPVRMYDPPFNQSGECQRDVDCEDGDGFWRVQRNSAVKLVPHWLAGVDVRTGNGTGVILNSHEKGLLVLTAKHVLHSEFIPGHPVAYKLRLDFNLQTAACNNYCPGLITGANFNPDFDMFLEAYLEGTPGIPQGAKKYRIIVEGNHSWDVDEPTDLAALLKSSNLDGDYALIQIEYNSAAATFVPQRFGICMSGWKAIDYNTTTERAPLNVASVSHPLGDFKKLQTYLKFGLQDLNEQTVYSGVELNKFLLPANPSENLNASRWDYGVPLKGSSGAGLFEDNLSGEKPLVGTFTYLRLFTNEPADIITCENRDKVEAYVVRFSHIFEDPAVKQALVGGEDITKLGSHCADGSSCFNGVLDAGETESDCCRTLACYAATGCPKCKTTTGLGGPTNEDFAASVVWGNLPGPCVTPGAHEFTVYANSSPEVEGSRIVIYPFDFFEEIQINEIYYTPGSAHVLYKSYRLSMPEFPLQCTAKLVTSNNESVNEKPFLLYPRIVAAAGPDRNICVGQSAVLGESVQNLSGANYHWHIYPEHGQAFLSDPESPNPVFTPTQNGFYTLYLQTFGSEHCGDNDAVYINDSPCNCGQQPHSAWARAGSCSQGRLNLAAGTFGTGTPPFTHRWEPAWYLSDPNVESPFVLDVSQTRTYTVTITDANFCVATTTVTVPQNAAVPGPTADMW